MGLQQSSGLVCQSSAARILRPRFGCVVGCSSSCALFYGCSCTSQLALRQTILHAGQCFIHSCWFLTRLSSHRLMYLQYNCTLNTPSDSVLDKGGEQRHLPSMLRLSNGRTPLWPTLLMHRQDKLGKL